MVVDEIFGGVVKKKGNFVAVPVMKLLKSGLRGNIKNGVFVCGLVDV